MVQRRFSGVEERLMHWANRSTARGWPVDRHSEKLRDDEAQNREQDKREQ